MATVASKHTFCRICEPNCPLLADFDADGRITGLRPDPEHPSGSIACHKGLFFLDIHNDPDRLNMPLSRRNPRSEPKGDFAPVDWETATGQIGQRLQALRAQYGPDSVAIYYGNPWGMSDCSAIPAMQAFRQLLGTRMIFSASTQDCINKIAVNVAVYGAAGSIMVPDLANTNYLLCLGANPQVSRWTMMSRPNDDLEVVRAIRRRGGKVIFVNPRKIESSTPETGPTLLIRPGTDVYFLAAVFHEIDRLGRLDPRMIATYGKRVEELRAFAARYPAERVASVVGIDVDTIRTVARDFTQARSAVAYLSTGVCQSRQGVLSFWLNEMVNFLTGNLGREGGAYKPAAFLDIFEPARGVQTIETSLGPLELLDPLGYSVLPAALLPDLIEAGDIRALLILGGNPLITVGGEDRFRRACAKLELMVSADIYRQATGELCDFILPTTDWLEHMDLSVIGNGGQPLAYVQYSDAMEAPVAERRDAWWIVSRLAQATGLTPPGETPCVPSNVETISQLLSMRSLTIEDMRALPQNTRVFESQPRDEVFRKCLQHGDGKIDCSPPAFERTGLFERCETIFLELETEAEDTLKLISLRTPYMQNSCMANNPRFRQGKHAYNPLHMNEADAARRRLHEGDEVRVFNAHGSIEAWLTIDNNLRAGAVAMTHGYGNRNSFGLQVAQRKPGSNCNALMPTGPEAVEPLGYMSWLSAVPVEVEPLRRSESPAADPA